MSGAGEAADSRIFLGWDAAGWRAALSGALTDGQPAPRSSLDAAAAWLLHRFGPDLSGVVVAVPGKRAGRRLEELLAERAAADPRARALWPPEIVTAGALTDRLLQLERPPASRLLRTLTWGQALRESDPRDLARIVKAPPDAQDSRAWLALAAELRNLHGALGAERLDFEQVAAAVARALPGNAAAGEAARWTALAAVQAGYRRRLAAMELGDPHDLRRDAIEAGRLDRKARAVLVGVVEMSGLLRAAVDALRDRVEALVFAPPERAGDFDDRGCVCAESWAAASVPLRPAEWSVVDRPADQAAAVVEILSRWQVRHPLDAVTLGVPDTEVVPFLRARLAEHDVPVRDAQGLELARTPMLRLVAALRVLLESGRFTDLAALVRHPHVEAWLATRPSLSGLEVAAELDEYQSEQLPDRVPRDWLGNPERAGALRRVQAELDVLLGELGVADAAPRPLRLWAQPIAMLLARLAGEGRVLERESEVDQPLLGTLEAVHDALLELAGMPKGLDETTSVGAADALAALESALAGGYVPRGGREPAMELLGWLELPLDEGPLILTGFNEGRIPQPLGGPGLLRDALRQRLGLPGDEQRLARDVYALCAIVQSGRELAVVTGRRTAAGDPLLPSRLLFHCADEEVPARLARWLPSEELTPSLMRAAGMTTGLSSARAAVAPSISLAPTFQLPRLPPAAPLRSLRVTAFRSWLQSPYRFYLDHVLRLSTVVARDELSPQAFGTLFHQVLEDFGRDEAARSLADASRIARLLMQALDRRVARTYGDTALPAVAVQVEQLRRRLGGFAEWQARRTAEGWRIHAVEWSPPGGGVDLDVDGVPFGLRGRIDRIDVHADGRWSVLDYKTSDRDVRKQEPKASHRRRDGRWTDLQLPLYRLLVAPLAADQRWTREPGLGYVALPADAASTTELLASWTEDELDEAVAEAKRVVRAIREGRFDTLGDYPERDDEPVFNWIAGRGLLSGDVEAADRGEEE